VIPLTLVIVGRLLKQRCRRCAKSKRTKRLSRTCRGSGMRVRIIRTVGGLPARTNAGAVEPCFDVAAFPYSPAGAFSIALGAIVLAFRVLGPIERKAVEHKPFAKVAAADRTGRDRPAIWVEVKG
jgi:hypothetical protein